MTTEKHTKATPVEVIPASDVSTMTATQKFGEWFEAEKTKGLVDIKFFVGDTKDSTVETFSKEALAFVTAERTPITKPGF